MVGTFFKEFLGDWIAEGFVLGRAYPNAIFPKLAACVVRKVGECTPGHVNGWRDGDDSRNSVWPCTRACEVGARQQRVRTLEQDNGACRSEKATLAAANHKLVRAQASAFEAAQAVEQGLQNTTSAE